MPLSITGVRSELGQVLQSMPADERTAAAHFSLAGQQANTLLHDGHAWQDFRRLALSATRRALRAAEDAQAAVLVHASFAFVHGVDAGSALEAPLRAHVDTILECETLALGCGVHACVVRLGYLYGAESENLKAYRTAFRLRRPYWSGPADPLQYHLHLHDAANALLAAADPKHAGKTYYATDGQPLPFRTFMDAFAHRIGRAHPLHLPALARPIAHIIIREEHMQQVALGMPAQPPRPSVPGWKPRFTDYQRALDDVVASWDE